VNTRCVLSSVRATFTTTQKNRANIIFDASNFAKATVCIWRQKLATPNACRKRRLEKKKG
jgi:hypothetical protein